MPKNKTLADVDLSARSQDILADLGVLDLKQLAAVGPDAIASHQFAHKLVMRELTEVLTTMGGHHGRALPNVGLVPRAGHCADSTMVYRWSLHRSLSCVR